MNHRNAIGILPAATTLLAAVVVSLPARAGSISGTASYRERLALPADAVFDAELLDAARADAPARELGRVRLKPAGQPSFRFAIPFRDSDITSRGRYAVRATVRQGERLLFTTDTFTPVLNGGPGQPLTLRLVRVGTDMPPAPNSSADIGRWRLEPGSNRLVLRGGREGPLVVQPLDGGAALRKAGLNGEPIHTRQAERLHLQGMVPSMADAASLRLCATGNRLPVAMEGELRRMQQACLRALPAGGTGQPLLVNLEGLITSRPSAEPGRPPQRTLVVERFVSVTASRPMASPSLRGTQWQLQAMRDGQVPTLIAPPDRPAELRLAADQERVSGTSGCNRLMGSFRLSGEQLSFSTLASTKMACPPPVMAFERRYVEALGQVRRWSIDKQNLLLQDARGQTLLLFRAVTPGGPGS